MTNATTPPQRHAAAIRVTGVEDLRRVVSQLRSGGEISSTKTLVVLEQWTRSG